MFESCPMHVIYILIFSSFSSYLLNRILYTFFTLCWSQYIFHCSSKGRLLVFRLEQKRRPKNDLAFSVRSTSALPSDSVLSESSNQNTETYPNYDQDIKMEDNARNSFPFPETDGWELILKSHVPLSGVVLAVAPYLDQYILTCAGNTVNFFSSYFVKW